MSYSKLSFMRHAYAVAVGAAAGVTSGLFGWGGAQVVIHSMIHPSALASYSQLSATGISLSALSLSSISAGSRFWADNQVNIPIALGIGIPAVFSARIGTHFAKKMSGNALELFFNGCSLILIPIHFWIQQQRAASSAEYIAKVSHNNTCTFVEGDIKYFDTDSMPPTSNNLTSFLVNNPLLIQHSSFGLFLGAISSLMGVGGLPLAMSYLTAFSDLQHHEMQGTTICALVPSILVSAASRMSATPPSTTACVAVGAFGGGLVGAKIALSLSEEQLRYAFMGSLVLFGGLNMAGAIRNIGRI